MDLLLAIQEYVNELIKHNAYPKKKPSLGKLEKMADLCMSGKFRKLSRYEPEGLDEEAKAVFKEKMDKIKEIVKHEKNS